jgi:signal transduction histidine kinase
VLAERARLARELHDTVAQTLYAITLGAVRARTLLEQNEAAEAERTIEKVLQLANSGHSELRTLLSVIRSHRFTSGGLVEALENLAAEARQRRGIDIRISVRDEPELPVATKEAVVMVAREALHNVAKHANASRVEIELAYNANQMVISITDNGRGFDPTKPRPGHFGLQSMRERAANIGGALALVSGIGCGTQVRLTIPAHSDSYG